TRRFRAPSSGTYFTNNEGLRLIKDCPHLRLKGRMPLHFEREFGLISFGYKPRLERRRDELDADDLGADPWLAAGNSRSGPELPGSCRVNLFIQANFGGLTLRYHVSSPSEPGVEAWLFV